MSPDPTAQKPEDESTATERWHAWLQVPGMKGERAALRRAQQVEEVFGVTAYHALQPRLGRWNRPLTAARIAMALATIRQDRTESPAEGEDADGMPDKPVSWGVTLGRALAVMAPSGKRRVSKERLRLLLSADDPDQFLRLLRSTLGLLDDRAPVQDVADVVGAWHTPSLRADVRRAIFLSYYRSLPVSEIDNA
ncbi:type I-E CRISPR-associated protein Cse2/CasB [Niveispirillum fermenti]|uniref:type I-E CRISPR-associated protein Cse2/CasB n=1 Tax=Niveispirillum fermenti TaxID=1233113 RepID=UPI003A83C377